VTLILKSKKIHQQELHYTELEYTL